MKNNKTPTKQLLDFICEQELELGQYHTLIKPLRKRFNITQDGKDATEKLIAYIINWEEQPSIHDSLEMLVKTCFDITTK